MQTASSTLETRLIQFGVSIINLAEKLPRTFAGNHLSGQLIRSGTSPALQYGEAQVAESRADFIHKMRIGLKELKESFVNLAMISALHWLQPDEIAGLVRENQELVLIFSKSIGTAKNGTRSSL